MGGAQSQPRPGDRPLGALSPSSWIIYLSAHAGIPVGELIQSRMGGLWKGTWVHPKGAIALPMLWHFAIVVLGIAIDHQRRVIIRLLLHLREHAAKIHHLMRLQQRIVQR